MPTPHAATEAPATGDIEVTPLIETTLTLIYLSLHTDAGFSDGPGNCSILTEYVDHVALWQGEVYILYDDDTLFINDTLKLTDAFHFLF